MRGSFCKLRSVTKAQNTPNKKESGGEEPVYIYSYSYKSGLKPHQLRKPIHWLLALYFSLNWLLALYFSLSSSGQTCINTLYHPNQKAETRVLSKHPSICTPFWWASMSQHDLFQSADVSSSPINSSSLPMCVARSYKPSLHQKV